MCMEHAMWCHRKLKPTIMSVNNNNNDFLCANVLEDQSSVVPQKGKGKFLYSAVFSPHDHSKRYTFYFPDRPVRSDTISASLGSIQPYATVNARRLLVYISTSV